MKIHVLRLGRKAPDNAAFPDGVRRDVTSCMNHDAAVDLSQPPAIGMTPDVHTLRKWICFLCSAVISKKSTGM